MQTASLAKANYLLAIGKLSDSKQLLASVERGIGPATEHQLFLLKAQLAAASEYPTGGVELAEKAVGMLVDWGVLVETDAAALRYGHSVTKLADGRVLITGGINFVGGNYNELASAEIYDPDPIFVSGFEARAAHAVPRSLSGRANPQSHPNLTKTRQAM